MRINKSLITFTPTSGAGSGTVTSVAMTVPSGVFTVVGTPITTSGTFTVGLINQFANTVWAGPTSGAENVPDFRLLVEADIPNLSTTKITSGTLGVDRGGTGAVTLTGVLFGNGTGAFTGIASTTATQILRVNSAGTGYEWFTPDYLSNVMTSLGDMIYGNAVGLPVRRSGNITTTKMFLSQTGDGSVSAAPQWETAVTSVALSMPSAFSVSGSPITTTGTLAVTGAGTASQYIRGDGQLATLPSFTSGGSSVNYYLNGSVNQGTIGGSVYYEMSRNVIIGAGTDFNRTNAQGNGLIAQFITDINDPNRTEIPAGAWNFEMFFSTSSSGGSPSFYLELLKYDGTTFTSIANNSAVPELITSGTATDLYLSSLAVPLTTLLTTDRLVVRVYVVTSGRTITLHTENSNLCEIVTTFSGGITSINGITENTQYLAVGTSGTDFNISSAIATHTFNLPTASATNRGALSSADWIVFNAKLNNPFLALGDLVYSNAGGIGVRRSGNITTTKMFLSQTGDGTSSAAPQWSAVTAADTGSVPTSRTITINGTTQDLSANRTFSVGTVTSVALSVPTGLSVSGSPITTSGTLAISLASGYSIPTTASQTNWDSAYNNMIVSAAVTGTTTKTLTLTQQDAGTITASWTDINTDAVTSVFGRTGAVVATSGDYTTAQVTESGNLYYLDSRARSAISLTTTGSSGSSTYNSTTGVLNVPTYTASGLGAVPTTRTITINDVVFDLSANREWSVGDFGTW